MTRTDDCNAVEEVVQLLAESGFEGMAQAFELLINEAMKLERSDALGAKPYERAESRIGYANGFKNKTVNSRLGKLNLQIPQTRGVEFYPSAIDRGERSERALKVAIAEMYVQGVSTRKVVEVTRELCGLEVTSTQVSRAAELLDEELEAWRQRPLDKVDYLALDARYEKVRHGGSVRDCSVLIAAGVTPQGHRSVLGVSVSLSEAEVHWRQFMESLIARGLSAVKFIVSDDHSGLNAARKACFPGIAWQRCQCHLQRNAIAYVPKMELRSAVASDIRKVFNASDLDDAYRQLKSIVTKYEEIAPKLSEWMETNLEDGLAVFSLPESHRRRMRTTNMVERLNQEIKRRTRVATLFPNEASLLRLVSAVLAEVSDEWETGKRYLTIVSDDSVTQQQGQGRERSDRRPDD